MAGLNLVLSLVLTPALGLEGPALGTAIPFLLAFPLLLGVGLRAGGRVRSGELARRAWLPAYGLGALLAGALVAGAAGARAGDAAGGAGRAGGGVLAYWWRFYAARARASASARCVRSLLRGLSSLSSRGAPRSRSEVWNSIPAGHSMPTSGSSKRKPDSAAGS